MQTERLERCVRFHARVVVETTSPLSIASGQQDGVFDTLVARDANGLPVLPGTSIAGVLRAAWRDYFGGDEGALFGDAAEHGDDGRVSRVSVTWGHIHTAEGNPVDGVVFNRSALRDDPILGPLLADDLPHRDHVALNARGSAAGRAKFDRSYVPVGHRFTFDVALEAVQGEAGEKEWDDLLVLLASPAFRLGGATRRGYGAFRIVACAAGRFDLRDASDRARYASLPTRLDLPASALETTAPPPRHESTAGWQTLCLELSPEDFWRSGRGKYSFSRAGKEPDALPYSERKVEWPKGARARLSSPQIVLPGSGIKGALAHRVAFHYHRLTETYADTAAGAEAATAPCPAVTALFGFADDDGNGHAGNVLVDDVRLTVQDGDVVAMQHNSIDRFTGGTRDGVLYAEEVVRGQVMQVHMAVRAEALPVADAERAQILEAFAASLADLCEGRLALGAAQAKGHGYFCGRVTEGPEWCRGGL